MLHHRRVHFITECDGLVEVAHKLFEHTWTLCTGFKVGNLTLLNDATSGDGAQEYAVFRNGHQVESLTVSWYDNESQLLTELTKLNDDPTSGLISPQPHGEFRTHAAGESCCHCA